MLKKLVLFLLISSFSFAEIEFEEYKLDNGLRVILHQDNSTPIVAVSVLYHVGSKNEKPDRTGFAHFFEHLMFEGSKNIPRGEYFKIVQRNGGTLNANTSFDRTFYYEILPSNQLELGLWLESERMLQLNIDSIGVETQRNVVKEEKKQRLDNQPYGSILDETFKRAYTKHPYMWTPIGAEQYIDEASLEEFMEFYETYYVPNNATLSIAGDINIDQAKEWIEKYFGSIPIGTKEMFRPNIVEPEMTAELRDTVYDNIQLPLVLHSYRIPSQGTKEYYALNMLTTLLSSGQSSRLYKRLVDKDQVAVFAGSVPLALEDPGQFLAYAIANVGKSADELEAVMQEELDKVKNELISENEFKKLQNQIENQFVRNNTRVASVAENLANYRVYFGDANLINTEIERYMEVTREDIKAVAEKYLNNNNRVVLYYLPKTK